MPRTARASVGGYCYHVLNRGNGRAHVHGYHKRYRGSGHVWQGRFKAFPIEEDDHLLAVLRYVERNPLRAGLVFRAEDWAWSSLPIVLRPPLAPWLDPGPRPRHPGWLEHVQTPHTEAELVALRRSAERGAPFGTPSWVKQTAEQLGLESSHQPPGRPRKRASPQCQQGRLFLEKES